MDIELKPRSGAIQQGEGAEEVSILVLMEVALKEKERIKERGKLEEVSILVLMDIELKPFSELPRYCQTVWFQSLF